MRLVLDGGDGDQSFLGFPLALEPVERNWFTPGTPRGPAILVQVVGDPHRGTYLALTSRVLAPIEDQLAERGYASVVVNVIRHPDASYRPTLAHLDAIGMAFVKLAD